jgi:hypothetical protein
MFLWVFCLYSLGSLYRSGYYDGGFHYSLKNVFLRAVENERVHYYMMEHITSMQGLRKSEGGGGITGKFTGILKKKVPRPFLHCQLVRDDALLDGSPAALAEIDLRRGTEEGPREWGVGERVGRGGRGGGGIGSALRTPSGVLGREVEGVGIPDEEVERDEIRDGGRPINEARKAGLGARSQDEGAEASIEPEGLCRVTPLRLLMLLPKFRSGDDAPAPTAELVPRGLGIALPAVGMLRRESSLAVRFLTRTVIVFISVMVCLPRSRRALWEDVDGVACANTFLVAVDRARDAALLDADVGGGDDVDDVPESRECGEPRRVEAGEGILEGPFTEEEKVLR